MKHIELLGGVTACVEHDSLLSSWVVWQEGSDIEHLSVDDNPDILLFRVLCDLVEGEDFSTGLGWLNLCFRLRMFLRLETRSVD